MDIEPLKCFEALDAITAELESVAVVCNIIPIAVWTAILGKLLSAELCTQHMYLKFATLTIFKLFYLGG